MARANTTGFSASEANRALASLASNRSINVIVSDGKYGALSCVQLLNEITRLGQSISTNKEILKLELSDEQRKATMTDLSEDIENQREAIKEACIKGCDYTTREQCKEVTGAGW